MEVEVEAVCSVVGGSTTPARGGTGTGVSGAGVSTDFGSAGFGAGAGAGALVALASSDLHVIVVFQVETSTVRSDSRGFWCET